MLLYHPSCHSLKNEQLKVKHATCDNCEDALIRAWLYCLQAFIGRPFVNGPPYSICLSVCLSVCLSCPVCDVGVLWPNGWMDQDATWYGGWPWPRPLCVRWEPNSPTERGTSEPHTHTFQPTLLWHGRPSQQLLNC